MASEKSSDLLFLIRSLTRVIYYVTDEEDQALISLANSLKKSAKHIWVFNAAFGIQPLAEYIGDWKSQQHKDTGKDIHDLLIEAYKADPKEEVNFYVITDPERWLRDEHVQRRVLNFIHQVHNNVHTIKMLIFVGSQKFIPHNLQRYISVVHDPGPGEKEIEEIIRVAASKMTMPVPPGISDLFRGLTRFEIHSAIAQSVIRTREEDPNNPRIDPAHILDFRRRQIHKTDLLQYVDTTKFTMGDLGGTHRFKAWAKKTRACWTPEGKLYGLKPPRGVLCVGVWGCGKSLATKCLGSLWGLPVVQLELGRLQGGRVGESESNAYRALRIIESLAPCVTGETLVTLADGTCRPIASLWEDSVSGSNEELHVQCWNERTLRVETTRVHTVTRRKAEAFRVEAANGFYVNATANHLHYVMRGGMPEWVRTDELSPGDMMAVPVTKNTGNVDCKGSGVRWKDINVSSEVDIQRLLNAECRWVEITSIESVGEQNVYDLACEGEDTHSFIANGLITHNCIVWVDEAEKSFAGTHSSSQSDAGTVARVVGILSTWIQETKAQVCLVMTANSLSTLPVEFVNRMDERFFFDLPSTQERIDILKIHLRKVNQNPEDYNLVDLAEKANNMVGREIEQALNAALIESFNEKMPCLDEGILGQTLEKKPRIVKTMVDEVRAVLEWVGYDEGVDDGIRARFASEPNRNEGSFKFVPKV